MANARNFETRYAPSRRAAATPQNARSIGRSCSILGALRGALTKMNERGYVRADIYYVTGHCLYTLTKQAGGVVITKVRGPAL